MVLAKVAKLIRSTSGHSYHSTEDINEHDEEAPEFFSEMIYGSIVVEIIFILLAYFNFASLVNVE